MKRILMALMLVSSLSHSASGDTESRELLKSVITDLSKQEELRRAYYTSSSGRVKIDVIVSSAGKIRDIINDNDTQYDAILEGANTASIVWCRTSDFLRCDYNIGLLDSAPPLRPPCVVNVAVGKQYAIYYNLGEKAGYINRPPISAADIPSLVYHFDPVNLCGFVRYGRLVVDYFNAVLDSEDVDVHCERVTRSGKDYIICNVTAESTDRGTARTANVECAFSAEYGMALVSYTGGGCKEVAGVQPYCWERKSEMYYRYDDKSDLWIYDKIVLRESIPREAMATINFSDVNGNITVDPRMFNFEGMGVPYGVPVYDKRKDGPSDRYSYVQKMHIGLDRICLDTDGEDAPSRDSDDTSSGHLDHTHRLREYALSNRLLCLAGMIGGLFLFLGTLAYFYVRRTLKK